MILLSGGLDSAVLATEFAGEHKRALWFNYGQENWMLEYNSSAKLCSKLGVKLETIEINSPITAEKRTEFLFGRNSLFAIYAADRAEGEDILLGATAEDQSDYPDCRPAWLGCVNELLEFYGTSKVRAPYVSMTKSDVIRRGQEMGVDFAVTHSCYRHTPCFHCASCLVRARGFADAGVTDPASPCLPINAVWDTVQGEGEDVGVPATFIRFQGCSVGCSWCDTKDSWAKTNDTPMMSIPQLVARAENSLVVITGGEPCEQDPGLMRSLVSALNGNGHRVSIETSGVGNGLEYLWNPTGSTRITLSPKIHKAPPKRALLGCSTLKFIVSSEDDFQWVRDTVEAARYSKPVFIQPLWGSRESIKAASKLCMEDGFRLSMQVHKYAGLK